MFPFGNITKDVCLLLPRSSNNVQSAKSARTRAVTISTVSTISEKLLNEKKAEKAAKMEERKEDDKSGKLSDMMAYLDEDGNIVEEPVDDLDKKIEEKVENQKRQ